MPVKAVFKSVENVGKRIKKSKKHLIWKFIIDDKEHVLEMFSSFLSNKKKIILDGKIILETSKISADNFNHGFYIEKNLVIIQEKGNDYDIRINSIWFAQLYGDVKPAGEFDDNHSTEYTKKKSIANVYKDKLHKTTGKSLRNYNEREEYETKARYDGQKYYQRDDKIENWSEIERKIHQVKSGQTSEGKTEEQVKKKPSNENAFDNFETKFSNGTAPQLHKAQSESVKKSFDDFDFPQPVQRNFSQNQQEIKQEVKQTKVEVPTKPEHDQDFLSFDVPSDNVPNQQVPSSNNVPSLVDFASVTQPGNPTFEVPTQKAPSLADLYKQSSSMNEIPFNNQVPGQGQNNTSQPQSLNLDANKAQPKSEPNKNDLWGSNLVNLTLDDITNKPNQGTHAYNKQSEFIHFNIPTQNQNNSNLNDMTNNFANMNMNPKQMNFNNNMNNNMGMMNNGMMNNMGMMNQNQNWNMQNNNMGMMNMNMNMNMNNGGNFNNMHGMNGRSYF